MDVFKLLFGATLIFALSACGVGAKTYDSVYNESSSPYCVSRQVTAKYIVTWEDGHVSVENAEGDLDAFKKGFVAANLDRIHSVEPDHRIEMSVPTVTSASNPFVSSSDTWGQEMVKAPALWSQGIKGQGILVGVVDATVDVTQPQIAPRIAVNAGEIPSNGIDDDGNGFVDDYYGQSFISHPVAGDINPHATHVSGIIAADPSAGSIEGMAPQAKIIPAGFISNGAVPSGDIGDAIRAMQYVASRGARIINASWGGVNCNASLANVFAQLSSQGILLVVAAGNEGSNDDLLPSYPASFTVPNQITVAAASSLDFRTSWSNYGETTVAVAAPGDDILSTLPNNSTGYMSGTSMAAPFVSGAAALLWSARPNATASQIRQAIVSSVDVIAGHEYEVASRGRINVQKALAALYELVP